MASALIFLVERGKIGRDDGAFVVETLGLALRGGVSRAIGRQIAAFVAIDQRKNVGGWIGL